MKILDICAVSLIEYNTIGHFVGFGKCEKFSRDNIYEEKDVL